MSKSLKRVERALREAGLPVTVREMDASTRSAAEAAAAIGVEIDRIAKSILFAASGDPAADGPMHLFITAGGQRVDMDRAAALAGGPLAVPDAARIRAVTGFAIGGVAPVGHLSPPRCHLDPALMRFETVWAAAGTPRHVFEIAPAALLALTGATLAPFTVGVAPGADAGSGPPSGSS